KLYVAVGENANASNSQSLNNRLGKILRINSDGTIPDDNPTSFQSITGTPTGANRAIWAVGLRNPFTTAFHPGTGDFFIHDAGSAGTVRREEINRGAAGANYGWPNVEGVSGNPNYTDPLFAYGPSTPGFANNAAITGGTFYAPGTVEFPSSYVNGYF